MPMRFRKLAFLLLLSVAASAPAMTQHTLKFRAAGTDFEVTVPEGLTATDAELTKYVTQGATAVATYFGHFPMKHLYINIRAVNGDSVRFGRSSPEGGGTIMMMIGRDARAEALNDDWTLTHEMSHQAFPAIKGEHEWLEEGMATYVEPIARAQAGFYPVASVWRQFVNNMPKGQPQSGDEGIDNTQSWGRTYWGGALFCLVADVEIRKQTHNRRGLEDAFRSIMNNDGTMQWDWPIEMVFAAGDKATQTHVLENLYREWKDKPVQVDLDKLWRDLGVEKRGDSVVFHDNAPEAAIRKAITAAR